MVSRLPDDSRPVPFRAETHKSKKQCIIPRPSSWSVKMLFLGDGGAQHIPEGLYAITPLPLSNEAIIRGRRGQPFAQFGVVDEENPDPISPL